MSSEEYIREAVATVWDRYYDPLSLDELARAAMMSKFHFIRVFRQTTGVSPGRFLSAVRLDRSKHLLRSTGLSAAEISRAVGYQSVGTFTRRFTDAVGISPIQYRRNVDAMDPTVINTVNSRSRLTGAVGGEMRNAGPSDTTYFVGVFPGRILQCSPSASVVVRADEPFRFSTVPVGTWYLLAALLGPDHQNASSPPSGAVGPVQVAESARVVVNITISEPDWRCPPIVAELPRQRRARPPNRTGNTTPSSTDCEVAVPPMRQRTGARHR